MARPDPHSYFDTSHPKTERIEWKVRVDFERKTVEGDATLHFQKPASGEVHLDTRQLQLEAVTDLGGQMLDYTLDPPEKILGERLRIALPAQTGGVRIRYATSPLASALQWLSPEQTSGGKHPFLFSQCQAIHARAVLPCQDTPTVRIRYSAEISCPQALTSVMAASFLDQKVLNGQRLSRFEMNQPIPPYLFAFAVGNLQSAELGPRSRVWAEPEFSKDAAWEFAEVDSMLAAAEKLFGPYDWERFDLLNMPPAFPYGGMENPRLTFLTPTLLAKDRSLVSVVAHELAHSWTGNLVSNASAEDFWLNEGFTVFAERRILEALEGPEMAALHAALGFRALERAVAQFRTHPGLTQLKTNLTGVDPDDAFSQVPYEKGYLFLRALEEAVGREAFSQFLLSYVKTFRFQSITTEDFVAFLEKALPAAGKKVHLEKWLREPGIPTDAPRPKSKRLAAVESLGQQAPAEALAKSWTPTEWQLYLESVSTPAPAPLLEELERRFHLTESRNYEVLVAWLTLALKSGRESVLERTGEVLRQVGRMKYLKPLYQALASDERFKTRARKFYNQSKEAYHPIARQGLEGILNRAGI